VDVNTEGAPAAETLRGIAPDRYGSAKFTNHQAELWAAVVGLPRLPVGGDGLIVMDNQAVITIMQREGKLTARERSKANDDTLEPRLLHIAWRINEHATQEGGEGAWLGTVREEGWEEENCRNMGLVGRHQVLWSRSHQEGEVEPNRFVVEGNEVANRGAGERGGSPSPPDVRLPVGGEKFFCIHKERMVTTEIGAYIRDWARSQAVGRELGERE
jgi:ribonuclease HI